jgi:hypothetical protein
MPTIRPGLLVLLILASAACKNAPDAPATDAPMRADRPVLQVDGEAPTPGEAEVAAGAEAAQAREYAKLDQLRARFPQLSWTGWQAPESPTLAKDFQAVRQADGWKAFVRALRTCDDAVHALFHEAADDWGDGQTKVQVVQLARNAWRRAMTHGIQPPRLSAGSTRFDEDGLGFQLSVVDGSTGLLVVRSQRGQVLGIFELRLDDAGRPHVVSHLLELALRDPEPYLSHPWDIVMVADRVVVPDAEITIDRVAGRVQIKCEATNSLQIRN